MNRIDWKKISGEPYDWTKTLKPERPYIIDYTKTLTYKLFLAQRTDGGKKTDVKINFEQALDIIKKLDKLTLGMNKVVYLVGWQFNGHDSKYPAWSEVNAALKRDVDKTAADSLVWLMNEAYKYNTTVSLHINMNDAYEDSPLWDEYVKKDVIKKNGDGSLMKGGVWDGVQCYLVSLTREWEEGLAQARIDALCEMLPIERAGTVHIDAMMAKPDPGHNYSMEDEQKTRNKIFRYWREHGIDVTSEFVYYESPSSYIEPSDHLIGLQPLAYHFCQTLEDYMKRPSGLICGVDASRMFKGWEGKRLSTYFGTSPDIENMMKWCNPWEPEVFNWIIFNEFRYKFLSSLDRMKAVVDKKGIVVHYSDKVKVYADGTISRNGVKIQNEASQFLPLIGTKEGRFYYSAYNDEPQTFDVGKAYGIEDGTVFTVRTLTSDGLKRKSERITVTDGKITLKSRGTTEALILF